MENGIKQHSPLSDRNRARKQFEKELKGRSHRLLVERAVQSCKAELCQISVPAQHVFQCADLRKREAENHRREALKRAQQKAELVQRQELRNQEEQQQRLQRQQERAQALVQEEALNKLIGVRIVVLLYEEENPGARTTGSVVGKTRSFELQGCCPAVSILSSYSMLACVAASISANINTFLRINSISGRP